MVGTGQNVGVCKGLVTHEIKQVMLQIVYSLEERLINKTAIANEDDCVEVTEKWKSCEVEGVVNHPKNIFKRVFGYQPTINNVF